MTNITQPVLVVGTGAMACLFSARLAAAGYPVKILGTWKEGLAALRSYGVRLQLPDGSVRAFPVEVTNSSADCRGAELALVLVKSWQTERASHQLASCLSDQGLALTLQNGLGNQETLAAALGKERTALGVTTTGATLVEPGLVRNGGNGRIMIENHPRIQMAEETLRNAGFEVELGDQAQSMIWGKLVINAAINPLTALLEIPNGGLLSKPETIELLNATAEEAASVAQALEIDLPYSNPAEAVRLVAHQTSTNISSMLTDILRGGPTEIDAINGMLVQYGEQVGVTTPLNRTLWALVRSKEKVRRSDLKALE